MTLTKPATTQTELSPPPASRRRRVLIAAGIVVLLASAALTAWLLSPGSQTHTRPAPATTAIAPTPQATPNVGGSAGYAGFCQNNSDLCAAPTPDAAYRQFCQNNSDLCTTPQVVPAPVDPYAQFCANNSDLCTPPQRP